MNKLRISNIFKLSPTPTSIIEADDPKFTFVKVNFAYCKMTQRPEEELIGSSLFNTFPANPNEKKPTGPDRLLSSFRKVIDTKKEDELGTIRYDIVLDDGNYKEVHWRVVNTPILDEKGNVAFIMNSATRVTEQILSQRISKMMLDNSEDSFILIDKNLNVKNFNQSLARNYKKIFGIDVETGKSILDYNLPYRDEVFKKKLQRVLTGEVIQENLTVESKDGATHHFDIKYKPAKDENDQIVGSFVSLIDKTEERKAELALERNEARYRALVENGNDVIFIIQPDTSTTYISPSIENVLGYSQEEAYEMDLIKTVHPDDVQIIHSELEKSLANPGIPIEVKPARMKHKNGEYRWMEATVTNMLHDPSINGIIDNFRDITEKFEYQRQVDEAKDQYESLVNTIEGIFWEADADTFLFKYVSPQAKSMLGYEPEKWVGSADFWQNKIHPEDRQKAIDYCHYKTQAGENHSFEYRMKKSDGSYIWIRDVVTVTTEKGTPAFLRGLMIDITEEKELRNKLDEAYKISKIGTWELDLENEKLIWSDTIKKLHEVGEDFEPDLDSALNFYKEGWSRNKISEAVDKAIQDGTSFDIELEIVTAKGNEHWIRAIGEPEFKGEKCIRIFGSTQDITQRKSLEQELDKVYRMAKIGNWEVDLVNDSIFWSDVVKDTFEVEPDFRPDIETAINFYSEGENRERIKEALKKAREEGASYDIELEVITAKGNKKWIRGIGQPEFKDGECVRIYGTTQEVTERKLAELELKDSNISLIERIKEQRCLYHISNLNEQELTINELVEQAVIMIPEGFQFPDQTHAEVELNGQKFQTDEFSTEDKDLVLTHTNNRQKDIKITITISVDNSGKHRLNSEKLDFLEEERTLLSGIANQISQKVDQIQKRKELQKADKKYRNVVEYSTNMFYQHDTDGVLKYVSGQSVEFLGYQPEEAMHKWTEFITDHPLNQKGEALTQKAIETGEIQPPYELQLKTNDGRIIWVEVHEAPLLDHGKVTGIVGSLTDITERKKYEEQLQKSLERYNYASKATRDAIYDWDIVNDSLHWGQGFTKLFGHKQGEGKYTIKKYHESVHPSDREEAFDDLKFTLNDSSLNKWSFEYRFQKDDGNYAHVLENGYIIRNEDGKAVRMIGALRDITEDKQVEIQTKLQHQVAQFFKNEDRLTPILDNLIEYLAEFEKFNMAEIWLVSGTGTHLNLISNFARDDKGRIFYGESKQVTKFNFGEGLPGIAWKNDHIEIWDNLSESESFIRRDAAKQAELYSASALPFYHNEEIVGILVVGSEETADQVQNKIQPYEILQDFLGGEIRRKQQEEEMQLLFESSPDILAITASNNHFVKVNPGFSEILGYSEEELTFQNFENFVHPDDRLDTLKEYEETVSGERQSNNYINRWITKTGDIRYISWSSSDLFGEDDFVFAFGRDVTDLKLAEQEIVEANQKLKTAQEIAHLGYWEHDLETNKLFWSEEVYNIWGLDPDQHDQTIEDFRKSIHPDDLEYFDTQQEIAISGDDDLDIEFRIILPDGTIKWVHEIGSTANSEGGKSIIFEGTVQDITEKKELELLLKQTTRLAKVGSWEFKVRDNEDDSMYWSELTREIFEVDKNYKPTLNSGFEFYEKESKKVIQHAVDEAIEQGTPFDKELEITTAKGNTKYVRCIVQAIIIDSKTERLVGSFQDITDRVKAEKERIRILESISDAFYALDKNWNFTYFNNEAESLLNRTAEELLGKNIWEEFPDAKESELHAYYLEAVKTNSSITFEYYYPPIDRWLEISVYPRRQGLSIFFRDITDRKEAAIKLQEAYEERENILQSIADGFFTLDKTWNVTYWNRAAEVLLQTPKQDIIGQNLWDVFEDATDLPSYTNYHRVMHLGKPLSFEDYYEPIDKWFDINAYPSEEGISVFFKDITDNKNAREALKELNKELEIRAQELAASNAELEQFAYVASHDLQEPLRMVSSFLTQLDKKYSDDLDEKANQYINFAVDGAKRMRQIILDLLNYSRLNQEKNKREYVDLNSIIEDVKALERSHIEETKAEIKYSDLPTIHANTGPIKQLFQNLINNAIKYQETGNQPLVEIGFSETDNHWKFSIKDNGIGIKEEFQKTIFQIFQRLHTRDHYSGTGIGLAISKKIVERHGGEIWLESAEGEGSTFYFTIAK